MAEIDVIIAVVLGIFQGIVEWLPISSSGQTILIMIDILKITPEKALSFAFYLHLGTLIAALLKYRKDVKHVVFSLPNFKEDKLVQFMVISTLCAVAIGLPVYLLLSEFFKAGYKGEVVTVLIGIFLILTGIILRKSHKNAGNKGIKELSKLDMVLTGIAQGFSVLPGISRSGMTVTTLITRDVNHEKAVFLSFLMSIPGILGLMILLFIQDSIFSIGVIPIIAGVFVSFIVGYLMIESVIRLAKKVRFDVFCIVFGIIALSLVAVFLI
jgi:undecaprenyl-diphosphatase